MPHSYSHQESTLTNESSDTTSLGQYSKVSPAGGPVAQGKATSGYLAHPSSVPAMATPCFWTMGRGLKKSWKLVESIGYKDVTLTPHPGVTPVQKRTNETRR